MSDMLNLTHYLRTRTYYTDNRLNHLVQQVAYYQQLTVLVRPYLPENGQWQVVGYTGDTLTLTSPNQAFISQVKYLKSKYIKQLQCNEAFKQLQDLNVLIQYPTVSKATPDSSKKCLPNSLKEQLLQTARQVKHVGLQRSLQRLAHRIEN